MNFGHSLYWRETQRPVRFLIFDGRVVVILVLTLMHIRFWTLGVTAASLLALYFFDRKGISADDILRFLRSRIVGRRRTARGPAAERSAVDYGFETLDDIRVIEMKIERRKAASLAARKKKSDARKKTAAVQAGKAAKPAQQDEEGLM